MCINPKFGLRINRCCAALTDVGLLNFKCLIGACHVRHATCKPCIALDVLTSGGLPTYNSECFTDPSLIQAQEESFHSRQHCHQKCLAQKSRTWF